MAAQKLLPTGASLCRQVLRRQPSLRVLPSVLNQSTVAGLQPREDVTPVRVGDSYAIKKRFTQQDILTYSQMTFNNNPRHLDREVAQRDGFEKPTVPESLIYSAVSGCGDQYMNSKGTVTVILNVSNQHPQPLYVGEDLIVEVRVMKRTGRKIKLECLSTEPNTGKIVGQAIANCLMPKGYPE